MHLLEQDKQKEKWFFSDAVFNLLYPMSIQSLAKRHWTPIAIAREAANFLAVENHARILDIGSGAGKFCLTAAYYKPKAFFYGVEQRRHLVANANAAKNTLHLENASFIHGNFTQVDFGNFDHFYFYNAFYENLACTDKIDDSIEYSGELYNYYNRYLYTLLEQKPPGTRLATYYSMEDEIPRSYKKAGSGFDNLLKFWIKI